METAARFSPHARPTPSTRSGAMASAAWCWRLIAFRGMGPLMNTRCPILVAIGWTRFMPMCLWVISCSVVHADDSEKEVPSPASERPLAPSLADAVRLLAAGDAQGALSASILAEAHDLTLEASYVRAAALIELERVGEAVLILEQVSTGAPSALLRERARRLACTALIEGAPELAELHSAQLLASGSTPADTRLHALTQVKQGRFPAAATTLATHHPELLPELESAIAGAPRFRSPGAAAGLALVPGVGHFYAGAPRQGASALLVNGVFATGIALAAREEAWGTVGVLGFFGLGFYMGNMYGAADAARRHNRQVLRSIERDLAATNWAVPPVWLPSTGQ